MVRIKRLAAAVLAILFMAAFVPQAQVSAASERQTNEVKVYNFLVGNMGLNSAAACGLMANVQEESNFNVKEIGDGNTSFGLFQWHRGRKANLIKYCDEKGLNYQSVEGQLSYLEYELKKSYKSVYNYIKSVDNSADGAYKAAYHWCYYYEVPSNRAYKSDKRGNIARKTYWKKYNGYSGKKVKLSDNSSAGSATTASTEKVTATTSTTAAVTTSNFTRTLTVRMKGADVKNIQGCLKKLGYSISVDGVYGNGTAGVVKKFQNAQGLNADGNCDQTTWNAIVKAASNVQELKITQQPKSSVTAKSGEKVTFSIKASGSGLTYQWYYKKVGAKKWTKWKNQNKATITATAKDCWAGRSVKCTVKDSYGKTVNSNSVKLALSSKNEVAVG